MAPENLSRAWRVWVVGMIALGLGACVWLAQWNRTPEGGTIPYFTTEVGKVRAPLPYRIVSFQRGRADKNLIKLAAQLGFNGVQFQIEGSNEKGIKDFAARDAKEHLIDYCHSLHMQVTVWVHEFSDLPPRYGLHYEANPDYLGPPAVDNQKLWDLLDKRYEWILSEAIPKVDGLALTTVETQVNATSTPLMLKLVNLIDAKCREHKKSLIVRTFVWKPEELEGVMGAVKQMPDDVVVMSKVVPQDWQMRGGNAAEIGAVGKRAQIVEYDVAGEYFLLDKVANCMVDLLKKQFDYGLSKGVQGICVRVDRQDPDPLTPLDADNISVLYQPQEVNLWALGMMAAGATDSTDEIWEKWAEYRYGQKAAPAVIAALKPTGDVVAEMLSVGPFTHGDTRTYPPVPQQTIFDENWQNWRWDNTYLPVLHRAREGDAAFVDSVRAQKAGALAEADQCLAELEKAKVNLPEREYEILHTKLLSNKVQLEFRSAAIMATMHYRQMENAHGVAQTSAALEQYRKDLTDVRALADRLKEYPEPQEVHYLGKTWQLGAPLDINAEELRGWLEVAQRALPASN